ncbi:MAG: hypothetical protein H0V09_01970 [Gemmatimonadetes bacterium]|nr:hypothetical protein [Gemmatimonadota bacterium]
MDRLQPAERLSWSRRVILAALPLGMIHHVDHVLRVDHSGWPFIPEVTPFTFSFLVYPLLLLAFQTRRPWLRVAVLALLFVTVQSVHTLFEPPTLQYATWARGYSTEPWASGTPNLLNAQSPALGAFSATVAVLLGVALLMALVLAALEARERSGTRASGPPAGA